MSDEVGEYDQFADKKRTTYDENIYTTEIDQSKVSTELQRRAEQIEKDILGQRSSNRHLDEERGLISLKDNDDDVGDEEARYGAVKRVTKSSNFKAFNAKIKPHGLKNLQSDIFGAFKN